MSLYILRGGLGLTGTFPPGLPEIRTAAARAAGTAGTAGTAGLPRPFLSFPGRGWEGRLQPFHALLLSAGPVAVESWDLASGLAVRGEVPAVAPRVLPFLCAVLLAARCFWEQGSGNEVDGQGWPVRMWGPFYP